jgi:hypothetical protein
MRIPFCVALCTLLLPFHAAETQQLDSLRVGIMTREVGSEVRVSTASTDRLRGRLLEVTPTMLRIQQSAGVRVVAFSSRDTLWVSESLGPTAAGYGAVAGLAGAAAIRLVFRSACGSGDDPCTGFGHAALILGAGGVALGAGVGLVAGEMIKRWVRVAP